MFTFPILNQQKKLDYNTRNTDKITLFHTKHNIFKHCFFHPLLLNGISVASLRVFKENLLRSLLDHLQ